MHVNDVQERLERLAAQGDAEAQKELWRRHKRGDYFGWRLIWDRMRDVRLVEAFGRPVQNAHIRYMELYSAIKAAGLYVVIKAPIGRTVLHLGRTTNGSICRYAAKRLVEVGEEMAVPFLSSRRFCKDCRSIVWQHVKHQPHGRGAWGLHT